MSTKRHAPTRQTTVRGRNPGRAIFRARPIDTDLAVRTTIEIPQLEWHQIVLTPEQANAQGLTTLRRIAEVQGYFDGHLHYYAKNKPEFPEPKALLIANTNGRPRLYDAAEVVAWLKWARSKGYIQRPHRK